MYTKKSIDMAEADDSTIANVNQRPNGVPENWIVNPHNNPDISMIGKEMGTSQKWIPDIRENWISPSALDEICPEPKDGKCPHTRETNAYYLSAASTIQQIQRPERVQ